MTVIRDPIIALRTQFGFFPSALCHARNFTRGVACAPCRWAWLGITVAESATAAVNGNLLLRAAVVCQLCQFLGTQGLLCFFIWAGGMAAWPAVCFKYSSATHTTHTPMS